MLGLVFTEMMALVETRWSLDMVDRVLARAGLFGAYTSVGDYPDGEMTALIGALAAESGLAASDLVGAYGQHLFDSFSRFHPPYFTGHPDLLSFLEQLDGRVHAEVAKLYPRSNPPSLRLERGEGVATLIYQSPRGLGRLAEALLQASIRRFGGYRLADVEDRSQGAGRHVRFTLVPVEPS